MNTTSNTTSVGYCPCAKYGFKKEKKKKFNMFKIEQQKYTYRQLIDSSKLVT